MKNIQEDDKKVKLRFSVKDSGIGIPKDKQKEIFKVFSQADGSIIRKFGGTGLGLTISSKIVQKLGRNIGVESEVGKGSEFYFTLEFEKCDKVEEENPNENKNVAYKAKILVAEDDVFNQELIKAILDEWDIDYTIVANGEEAVENVKKNNYDFIFLDINMPKMNGVEAVKEIKKIKNVPVIAMTANAFKEDVDSYFKAGFDDYISKPIKLSKLQRIFRKYVNEIVKNDKNSKNINKKRNYISFLQNLLNLDKNVLLSLVEVYFENVEYDLKKLKIAIEKEDFEDIVTYAHKIKGSSLNLKFDKVGKIVGEMEKNAKKKLRTDYKIQFDKINDYIENIKEEVKNENNSI